jgi:hypothetical protein
LQSPRDEEIWTIEETIEPGVPIGKAEQYLLKLAGTPHIRDRLTCWLFTQTFAQPLSEVDEDLNIVIGACQELRGSQAIRACLSSVLIYGNYMNGGN